MARKISAENVKLDRLVVKGLLGQRDKSASDLARYLGVTPQHVSDLLHGRRKAGRQLTAIAEFLGVAPRKILARVSN